MPDETPPAETARNDSTTEPTHRPPWWPEGEPWPPERWGPWWRDSRWDGGPRPPWMEGRGGHAGARRMAHWRSRGLARRFGCLIVLLAVVVTSIGVLVLWLLATLLGFASHGGPFDDLARAAGLVVLVVGAITISIGIRLARSIAPPIGDLVEAAGRVEAGDYAVRVPEVRRGPAELRDLGRAFNTMTARLEADEAQRRRLLADVSHELRTPLAIVQGNLEALIDGVYPADDAHLGPILEETRVIERLIGDLRTLSLAEAGTLALHRESTDVGVLLADVVEGFRPRAREREVTLVTDMADDLPLVDLDPIRIREVISNLIDNALRYVSAGGHVTVSAVSRHDALRDATSPIGDGTVPHLDIAVADDGPGIPADLLPTVFDRFAKTPESRGSGLGLAIARAIVEAHGGAIEATSPSAAGTTIRVSLPIR
jgi:two-component system, OmpR family, sensor histidine kinase BaeS